MEWGKSFAFREVVIITSKPPLTCYWPPTSRPSRRAVNEELPPNQRCTRVEVIMAGQIREEFE